MKSYSKELWFDVPTRRAFIKGKAFNLENHVEYAAGSVVSKTLIKGV